MPTIFVGICSKKSFHVCGVNSQLLDKIPEFKEIILLIKHEIQQAQRRADEIILDDEDVMHILKISKRRLQYLKADGIIPYHKFDHSSPRCYYLLSDLLEILKKNRIEAMSNEIRIK